MFLFKMPSSYLILYVSKELLILSHEVSCQKFMMGVFEEDWEMSPTEYSRKEHRYISSLPWTP